MASRLYSFCTEYFPAHLTIAKNIEIPSLDPDEIKEIIDLQAGRHTPYSRGEIIIDYINIGTYRENYTKILLVIVTLSVVRRQIEILAKAGLITEKVFFAHALLKIPLHQSMVAIFVSAMYV